MQGVKYSIVKIKEMQMYLDGQIMYLTYMNPLKKLDHCGYHMGNLAKVQFMTCT